MNEKNTVKLTSASIVHFLSAAHNAVTQKVSVISTMEFVQSVFLSNFNTFEHIRSLMIIKQYYYLRNNYENGNNSFYKLPKSNCFCSYKSIVRSNTHVSQTHENIVRCRTNKKLYGNSCKYSVL